MSAPSFFFSSLINTAPIPGFYHYCCTDTSPRHSLKILSCALYSSRRRFIPLFILLYLSSSFSHFLIILSLFPYLSPSRFLYPLSPLLSLPYSTSFSLFFFFFFPYFSYLSILPLYIPCHNPSLLFSSLINAAPKRRFYSLLLYLLYLSINFQKTSFSLSLLPSTYIFLLYPSLPLSLSFFYSFLFSPFFLFFRSFPISLSSFSSLICSIFTSFSLFFFFPLLYLLLLPLYTSSIYTLSLLPFYFPR